MNGQKNGNKIDPKKNNLIKLYPFNGRSPYLIDKFYIIGYDSKCEFRDVWAENI